MKTKQQGFTLAEMAMVIAVLGLLSALVLPSFDGMVASSRKAQVKQLAHQLNQGAIAVNALAIGEAASTDISFGNSVIALVNQYPDAVTVENVVGGDVDNVLGGGDLLGTSCADGVLFEVDAAATPTTTTFNFCINGVAEPDCGITYTQATDATTPPVIALDLDACAADANTPDITISDDAGDDS